MRLFVSDYGSLNYTIPLDIPIGIKEMHPSISLSYNSQMSNGMLGLGWSVTGLSSVNRVGRTYINDGDNLEIQFTTKDNLEIDGKRLHLSRGQFFMKESRYMIENEIGSEVILKESGGKLFFEVYSKDGLVRIYGATDDSNINVFPKGETLSWLLNKVIDKNGNYISYEYEKQNNPIEYTLKKISYTGNEKYKINQLTRYFLIILIKRTYKMLMFLVLK